MSFLKFQNDKQLTEYLDIDEEFIDAEAIDEDAPK
jgi:hypothetical protein